MRDADARVLMKQIVRFNTWKYSCKQSSYVEVNDYMIIRL